MENEDSNTSGMAIIGFFIGGGLCALFWGFPGFILGGIGGALIGLSRAKDAMDESRAAKVASASSDSATAAVPLAPQLPPEPMRDDGRSPGPSIADETNYADAIVVLIAGCVVADGKVEQSELKMATTLIKSDDFLTDKKSVVERIQTKIRELFATRKESKAAFYLKIAADLNRLPNVDETESKERLLLVLDGMREALGAAGSPDTEEFIAKARTKINKTPIAQSKQQAAESYILNSGDREAIEVLRQMRANPGGFESRLRAGARDNTVLKTALGVFTGFIAADLVTSTIHQYQLQKALEEFDAYLADLGEADGLDTVDVGYYGQSDEVNETLANSGSCESNGMDDASAESEDTDGGLDLDDSDFLV